MGYFSGVKFGRCPNLLVRQNSQTQGIEIESHRLQHWFQQFEVPAA
jgi:hypothetical protein